MKKIGYEFMEKTQYQYLDASDQSKGVLQPPIEIPYDSNQPLIDLVDIKEISLNNVNLIEIFENRKSVRDYANTPLTLSELSYLLWATQGIKKNLTRDTPSGKIHVTFRTVPSAGARHPFETFILINNVEGIKSGLYRYLATIHKLIPINTNDDIADLVVEGCMEQEFVKQCAATFIWVADSIRTRWRYGGRGIRYIHLDAGHVCQNLYLSALSINAGVCAIAAFDDEKINHLLNLDGKETFVTYIGTVGKLNR